MGLSHVLVGPDVHVGEEAALHVAKPAALSLLRPELPLPQAPSVPFRAAGSPGRPVLATRGSRPRELAGVDGGKSPNC